MPLDFTNAHAPPTLGKKRTKEDIEEADARARRKKYDIKNGLRDQGGFTDSFRDWDRKKQKEYSSIIARQEKERVAQFGELPEGWTYMQDDEISEAVGALEKNNFFDRKIQTTPRVTGTYESTTMAYRLTAKVGKHRVAMMVTDEELFHAQSMTIYFQYSLDHLIYRLAKKVREEAS